MAHPFTSVESREVLRCDHCSLVQFLTANCHCRRCHKVLHLAEPALPALSLVGAPADSQDPQTSAQVAAQVREIRKSRHLSQRQLAGRMQVPRTYISKIENGKAIPTLSSLERLAAALEVDVCQLVRDHHSKRDEEVAAILADPFLAEVAAYLPRLDGLLRSRLLNQARDLAREPGILRRRLA